MQAELAAMIIPDLCARDLSVETVVTSLTWPPAALALLLNSLPLRLFYCRIVF